MSPAELVLTSQAGVGFAAHIAAEIRTKGAETSINGT
jgi:hypothetical protein